jgi:hypothetical protein
MATARLSRVSWAGKLTHAALTELFLDAVVGDRLDQSSASQALVRWIFLKLSERRQYFFTMT